MLKRHLKESQGDFSRCFVKFDQIIGLHFNKVIESWQDSINRIKVKSNTHVFSKLRGLVTHTALDHMVNELARSQAGVFYDKKRCGCTVNKVFKLPCACRIGVYHHCGTAIPLEDIDSHWKHLSFDVFDDKSTEDSIPGCDISFEMEGIWNRFNKMSEEEKYVLKKVLKEIAWPSTTSMVAPTHKAKTKGAPKKKKAKFFDAKREPSRWEHVDEKMRLSSQTGTAIIPSSQHTSSKKPSNPASKKMSQGASRKLLQTFETRGFLRYIRPHMHDYVEKIINVVPDGNCGFRAIGVGLDMGEESWSVIRQDLIKESKEREELYTSIYGKNRLLEIRKAFTPEGYGPQKEDKWLDMPEMGYFIATKYNVALVQLSLSMNQLYLPLRGSFARSEKKMIAIMNQDNYHWLHVTLSPSCPLPPVDRIWWEHRSEESKTWIDPYIGRQTQWQSLDTPDPHLPCPPPTSYDAPIDLAADTDDI